MLLTLSRRDIAVVLGCLAIGSLCEAQEVSLERFAGGARLQDVPATSLPLWAHNVVAGPDGFIYAGDMTRNRIVRFDPATNTASVMRTTSGQPLPAGANGIEFDPAGNLYIGDTNRIYRLDPATGEQTPFLTVGNNWSNNPFLFDSSGRLFAANSWNSYILVLEPWSQPVTFAGSPFNPGFQGDGGPAAYAALNIPRGIAADAAGNIYIADTDNNRVRKVDALTGIINTVAGNGQYYSNGNDDDVSALEAAVGAPYSVAVDGAGNLFIGQTTKSLIRKVDAGTGLISTVVGRNGPGYYGDGGPAVDAGLDIADRISTDSAGNLYFADAARVRRVDAATGIIDTVLGNGTGGFCAESAPRLESCLHYPHGLAVDASGDVFISDGGNLRIRKVSATTGELMTYAGRGFDYLHAGDGGPALDASFGSDPAKIALDSAGNMVVAGGWNHRVRRIDAAAGIITTLAGNGQSGFMGDGGPAALARLNNPRAVAFAPNGDVYVADAGNNRIRKIDASTGVISTIAGNGLTTGALGDGGPATAASLYQPDGLAFDSAGNLLIVDSQHYRIRKVAAETGIITTVAGNGSWQVSGDDGPAVAAGLGHSLQMTPDAAGNIFVASANYLRRIDAATGIITAVPNCCIPNEEGVAFEYPTAMAFDGDGNLYITDGAQHLVIRINGLGESAPDTTPPEVQPNIVGVQGNAPWYTSDVQVSWSVTDAESPVTSQTGCAIATIDTDGAGITFACTATSSGGTTTQSVTINRDATPPTLEFGAHVPAADSAGWNNSAVSIPFTAQDNLSGVDFTTPPASPLVIAEEGVAMVETVTVMDRAGNSVSLPTAPVNIDMSPPVVTPQVSGTLGTNGWHTTDVQINWAIDESPGSILGTTGCEAASVTTDTAGITFNCSVTSAGGTASSSVTIKRDATPPVLTYGTPSPVPNVNGWNKVNISIPFTSSDALSGVASASANSPLVLSTEGAAVTGVVAVTDSAGNVATFTSVPRNIDKTPPVVEFASPAQGATYGFYQDVVADYSCTDVSLLSCVAPTPDGELVNTRTAGARTFKVTAKDSVSFTTAVTHEFTVESAFNFEGFIGAVAEPPTLNLVSRGALVPIRWRLPDGRGGFVTNPASFSSATVGSLTCGSAPVVPFNDPASGPAGISFDPATSTFTYNWQTGASWTGCRKLTIKLKDNSLHELRFRFQ